MNLIKTYLLIIYFIVLVALGNHLYGNNIDKTNEEKWYVSNIVDGVYKNNSDYKIPLIFLFVIFHYFLINLLLASCSLLF